jgi:RNA polymerase sigma factor (sigma-70 family)
MERRTDDTNNEATVLAFKQGDQAAFTRLYNIFYQPLYWYASGFVGDDNAAGIVCQAFLKAWDKRETITDFKAMRLWLKHAVSNSCIDHVRKENSQRRRGETPFGLDAVNEEAVAADEGDQLRHELKAAVLEKVYEARAQLPDLHKQIFDNSFVKSKDNEEVATLVGKSEKTVANIKTELRRQFRIILNKQLEAGLTTLIMYYLFHS